MRAELDRLKQEYQTLEAEKMKTNATLSQLQKLEDSKSFDQNKRTAMGGGPAISQASATPASKEGFQFFHLALVALVSLLVGAFISRQAIETAASPSDL